MSKASRYIGGAVAAALLVPAMPANAFPLAGQVQSAKTDTAHQWGGGWYGRRHRDRVDVGDVITGVVIIGVLASVLGSVDKSSRRDRNRDRDRDRDYPQQRYPDNRDAYPDRDDDRGYSGQGDEDQAINDCAVATESRAGNSNTIAQVRDVNDVQSISGGYRVSGVVDTRLNYRSGVTRSSGFTCDWQNGRVSNVRLTN